VRVGGVDGHCVGLRVGRRVGGVEGCLVGLMDGVVVGCPLGVAVGALWGQGGQPYQKMAWCWEIQEKWV
jgi:hypothetical protein